MVVWSAGYGVANSESGEAVTADTIFYVSNMAMPFTAWAIMTLVENGLVDLDAPVQDYLESWTLPETRYRDRITVRRLLSHTSGAQPNLYFPITAENPTVPTLIDLLSLTGAREQFRLLFSPTAFQFSRPNYVILQLIIEDVTGMPYADYVQQAILDPLELDHTTFRFDANLQPQVEGTVAGSYELDESLWQVAPDMAGYGLFSSANDLAAFLAAHTNESLLSQESIAALGAPADYTNSVYGLGYFTHPMGDGERVVLVHMLRHGGEGLIVAQPQTGEGLVILLNSNNSNIDQPLILAPILCAWDAWANEDFAWLCEEWGSPP